MFAASKTLIRVAFLFCLRDAIHEFHSLYFQHEPHIFRLLIFKLYYRLGKTAHIFFACFFHIMEDIAQNNNVDRYRETKCQSSNKWDI